MMSMSTTKDIEKFLNVTVLSGSLDANVLLRVLLIDVPAQHDKASRLLQDTSHPFIVADTAIIEVVFVLGRNYGFNRAAISEAVEGLMELPQIDCNNVLFQKALPLYVQYPALSFEDCCLATYADLNDARPLWTFDKKLANQAPSVKLIK